MFVFVIRVISGAQCLLDDSTVARGYSFSLSQTEGKIQTDIKREIEKETHTQRSDYFPVHETPPVPVGGDFQFEPRVFVHGNLCTLPGAPPPALRTRSLY